MLKRIAIALVILTGIGQAWSQTPDFSINRADGTTLKPCTGSVPCKAGNNIGTPIRIDSANWWANILQGDPNSYFEPTSLRQVFVQNIAGDTTHVVIPPFYTFGNTVYPANDYVGAIVDITAVPNPWTGAERLCHATVTANPQYVGLANATTATAFAISSNVVTVTAANPSNVYAAGQVVALSGLSNGTYLNNVLLTIMSASSTQFSASFIHADTATTSDAGAVTPQDVLTLNSACGAATQAGDVFTVYLPPVTTTAATWGRSGILSGGASFYTETTSPYDGAQSLGINTTSGTAVFHIYSDDDTHDLWHVIKGTWTLSVAARAISGTTGFDLPVTRTSAGGAVTNVCTAHFSPTSSWSVLTATCTPNENASTTPGLFTVNITQPNGANIEYDDVSFKPTSGRSSTNLTPFADEQLAADCFIEGGCGPVWGMMRAWYTQHGETFANWIKPVTQQVIPCSGDINFQNCLPMASLPNILERFREDHAIPYIVVPITFTDAEWTALIDWLGTTQSGMTQPWVTSTAGAGVFPMIYLEVGNEAWNSSTFAQSIPYRPGDTTQYQDYLDRLGWAIAAGRASSKYLASSIKFQGNIQSVNGYGITAANGAGTDYAHMISLGAPDGWEPEAYMQSFVSDFDTVQDQWAGAFVEPISNYFDTQDPRQQTVKGIQALNSCGPAHNSTCAVSVYEQGPGTGSTCTSGCSSPHNVALTQNAFTQVSQGAGEAISHAMEVLTEFQNGYTAANEFAQSGYGYTIAGVGFFHGWHNFLDMGGGCSLTNAAMFGGQFCPSPAAIGVSMLNAAIIGRQTSCPNALPYSFGGSNNGYQANGGFNGLKPLANVPRIVMGCWTDDAGNFTTFLINADQTSAHTGSFAGTNAPTGTVQVKTFAPTSLNNTNEILGTGATNTFAAQVPLPTTSTVTNPTSVTVCAGCMVALSYGAASPVAPSVTTQPSSQTVTIPATATFTVAASGTAPLTYQWKRNGVVVSGATAASYTTPATSTSDNGASFTVTVSNSAGSVNSNPATLTAATAPAASTTRTITGTFTITGTITIQ